MARAPQESQEPTVILSSSDEPFKTEKSAKAAITNKKLKPVGGYKVVPMPGGFGIFGPIVSEPQLGPPKKARESSEAGTSASDDLEQRLGDVQEGANQANPPKGMAHPFKPSVNEPWREERCYWTMFHESADPEAKNYVELGVNNDLLKVRRGDKVPLPERFIQVGQHTTMPVHGTKPGMLHKTTGHVCSYPHQVDTSTPCSWDEYLEWRRSGTEIQRKARAAQVSSDQMAVPASDS